MSAEIGEKQTMCAIFFGRFYHLILLCASWLDNTWRKNIYRETFRFVSQKLRFILICFSRRCAEAKEKKKKIEKGESLKMEMISVPRVVDPSSVYISVLNQQQ